MRALGIFRRTLICRKSSWPPSLNPFHCAIGWYSGRVPYPLPCGFPRSLGLRRPAKRPSMAVLSSRAPPWCPRPPVPSTASAATKGHDRNTQPWLDALSIFKSSMAERGFRAHWTTPICAGMHTDRAVQDARERSRPSSGEPSGRMPREARTSTTAGMQEVEQRRSSCRGAIRAERRNGRGTRAARRAKDWARKPLSAIGLSYTASTGPDHGHSASATAYIGLNWANDPATLRNHAAGHAAERPGV
jgi:hypothetical protein